MLSLIVDEGYAYDYLAILKIKKSDNFNECSNHIESQIGKDKHEHILQSNEFKSLLNINQKTFDAVEKARYGYISAKEVDSCNMERYKCKVNLHNKFFSESVIIENKT